MDVTTKLITYATVSNSGTFAGRPYDLYKQVRYDARRDIRQVRYIERYHPFVDDSLAGVPPRTVAPVAEKQKGLSSDRPYIFVFYRYD